jgi:hypothetical protein
MGLRQGVQRQLAPELHHVARGAQGAPPRPAPSAPPARPCAAAREASLSQVPMSGPSCLRTCDAEPGAAFACFTCFGSLAAPCCRAQHRDPAIVVRAGSADKSDNASVNPAAPGQQARGELVVAPHCR